jgi:hypothetical protein
MKTIQQEKQENNKNTFSSVIAGVAGTIALTGIAVATIALKDEKTRKKVKDSLIKVKDQAIDYFDTLKTKPKVKKEISKIKKP